MTEVDYDQARDKSRELLRQILPEQSWIELEEKGTIKCTGEKVTYILCHYGQTEIRSKKSGRSIAFGCLAVTIPVPVYDRLVAEYLLIKNNERLYWKTANIFPTRPNQKVVIARLFLMAFDVLLLVNFLLAITLPLWR